MTRPPRDRTAARSRRVLLMVRVLPMVVVWSGVAVESSAAQEEAYDGRSTDDTVRLVVGGLVAIAVATAVLTMIYLWHTSPRRRQRIAARRAAGAAPVEE